MWQKTYRIRLGADVTAEQVIKAWKENLPILHAGQHLLSVLTGIVPGQVVLLNCHPGGPAPAAVPDLHRHHVIYADDESFTFMTPQGHMFAGMITFSAEKKMP